MAIVMATNGKDAAKWFTFVSSVAMACWTEKNFFFYFMFFLYYSFILFLPQLLKGKFTTWLQAQKHTRVHSPDGNVKTHVQRKQMYVGLHHLVQILYCNQTLCVCVCVCVCVRAPKT
jgi:hypothetical protein